MSDWQKIISTSLLIWISISMVAPIFVCIRYVCHVEPLYKEGVLCIKIIYGPDQPTMGIDHSFLLWAPDATYVSALLASSGLSLLVTKCFC